MQVVISIEYISKDHGIEQLNGLEFQERSNSDGIVVDPHALKPCDQEGWLLAQAIDRFDHRLVREFLRWRSQDFGAEFCPWARRLLNYSTCPATALFLFLNLGNMRPSAAVWFRQRQNLI